MRLYSKKSLISCLITGLLAASTLLKDPVFAAPEIIDIDNLSRGTGANGIPIGWQTAWFDFCPRRTIYSIENEKGKPVLKASSRNSASAIYREVSIDPKVFPVLTWRWKVSNIIKKGNEYTKEGDDYSARLYVSFEFKPGNLSFGEMLKRRMVKAVYGKELPGETIEYVWANKLPKGSSFPNPDTDNTGEEAYAWYSDIFFHHDGEK